MLVDDAYILLYLVPKPLVNLGKQAKRPGESHCFCFVRRNTVYVDNAQLNLISSRSLSRSWGPRERGGCCVLFLRERFFEKKNKKQNFSALLLLLLLLSVSE